MGTVWTGHVQRAPAAVPPASAGIARSLSLGFGLSFDANVRDAQPLIAAAGLRGTVTSLVPAGAGSEFKSLLNEGPWTPSGGIGVRAAS